MIRGNTLKTSSRGKTFDVNISIHNRFDVEVVDVETGELKQRAQAFNVITDVWWKNMSALHMRYIKYGSGKTQPSTSDVKLGEYIGYGGLDKVAFDYDDENGVVSYRKKYQLPAGSAVGKEISEVGLSHTSGNDNYLHTHALLQDMNGNPISILKTDRDVINFYATVFIHYDPNGYDGLRLIPGSWLDRYGYSWSNGLFAFLVQANTNASDSSPSTVSIPTVLNLSKHGGYHISKAGEMYTNFYGPTSSVDGSSEHSAAIGGTIAIDGNAKTLTFSYRFDSNKANYSGYKYGCIQTGGSSQYNRSYFDALFETPCTFFEKSHVKNEAVGTGDGEKKDFELSFGYAKNLEVKVDGVVVNNYDFDTLPKVASEYALYSVVRYLPSLYQKLGWVIPEDMYEYNSYHTLAANSSYYFELRLNEIGIATFGLYWNKSYSNMDVSLMVSDDGIDNWVEVAKFPTSGQYQTEVAVPEEYRKSRFWRVRNNTDNDYQVRLNGTNVFTSKLDSYNNNHLHFAEPPAAGSIITVSYDTPLIAKDENHVFDLSVKFKFNQIVD